MVNNQKKSDPYEVVRQFEAALCDYTGARYAVTVTSCTMALVLALAWCLRPTRDDRGLFMIKDPRFALIDIPRRTYVSVPMSIVHAGGWPTFRDEEWVGEYQLKPFPIWDSARWLTGGMYRGRFDTRKGFMAERDRSGQFVCLSFHWSKHLAIQQGGAILHDSPEADAWLRRARFDGRTEGVAPKDDRIDMIGWHCYMSPELAADGLIRLGLLPRHNEPLPNDDYPDLSRMEIFR